MNLSDRPKRNLTIEFQGKKVTLQGLLDTGANASIISPDCWPQAWPLQPAMATVTGVGGLTLARKLPVLTVTIDGKILKYVFSIVPLPPAVQCLVGRDILAQLGIVLTNEHPLG